MATVAALLVGLLACMTGAASAEAPLRVNDQITDKAGALGTDPSRVQSALDRLSADTGMRLYVVYVVSFSGRSGQDWAASQDWGMSPMILLSAQFIWFDWT